MATGKGKDVLPGETRWVERGVFVRRSKDGKVLRFGISFLEGGKRRQQVVADTLAGARRALEARHTDVVRGEYRHESRRQSTTFGEFTASYLQQAANEKRSIRRDELAVRAVYPFIGRKLLEHITASDIRDFATARLEGRCTEGIQRKHDRGLSKATANRDLAVIKHILQRAMDDGLLQENPARKVKLFRVQERDRRVLSQVEERRLISAAAPHLKPLILVALQTGLRRSELMTLEWSDVSFETGSLHVRRQTKSYRNRSVPLNPTATAALRSVVPASPEGRVFRFNGNAIDEVKKSLRSAVARAGIPPVTLHVFRHTFATRLVLAGAPLPTVQKLLGHASIITTMRYAHPAPDDLVDAVNLLGKNGADMRRRHDRLVLVGAEIEASKSHEERD